MSQSTLAFNEAAPHSTFNFGAHTVRVIVRDGQPWFVATDVAMALGYSSPKDAAEHLDADEKGSAITRTPGGDQRVTVINESGLYALVLRSRKPEARKFAKWVTGEVLPSIRKTGMYAKPAALPRLQLRYLPPASGTYRYDPANPYPATGRTIEVAKSIVADIRSWGDSLPGTARQDLYEATEVLNDLLVSGWTEVDEALGQMHCAIHMLNRWQGRGGRSGNLR
ncbi:Bro-N domain-containing protein [Comamonas aquatica]|jgi:hypothetical protein|uniref:BRO-N domain-containing protein n=1 Tax=Comamonas aquatica TaxID=225991 RepID=UPI0028D5DA13|nr:Bro-N domain-containing protein [Comamonas aquatica]